MSGFVNNSYFGWGGKNGNGGGGEGGGANPIYFIQAGDFEPDGVTVSIPALSGKTFYVFFNNIPDYIIYNSADPTYPASLWKPIVGGGFEILIPGFNAGGANSDCQFFVMVAGTASILLGSVQWQNVLGKPLFPTMSIEDVDLSANTEIPFPVDALVNGQLIYYYITPNGFQYTWATGFVFPYSVTPIPSAGVGAIDVMIFQYRSNTGSLYCINQVPGFNQSL